MAKGRGRSPANIQKREPTVDDVIRAIRKKPHLLRLVQRTEFTGPITDPDTLAQYAGISPDLVNRIVSMAEKEQDNRHVGDRGETHFEPVLSI